MRPIGDSDKLAHPHSVIRLCCPHEDTSDPWLSTVSYKVSDQTAQMRRLIWISARRACSCALAQLYASRFAKTGHQAIADRKGPDQTAHPRSLIRAFTVHKRNHWILQNVSMESKCPDETLPVCRVMWICILCACSKAYFRLARSIRRWTTCASTQSDQWVVGRCVHLLKISEGWPCHRLPFGGRLLSNLKQRSV